MKPDLKGVVKARMKSKGKPSEFMTRMTQKPDLSKNYNEVLPPKKKRK